MAFDYLIGLIEKKFNWKNIVRYPKLFNNYRWNPKFVFYDKKTKLYVAFDIIYNQQIPEKVYQEEIINKALRDNANLRFCLLSSIDYEYQDLKSFCKNNKIGLKVYSSDSINTIHPFPSEAVAKVIKKKIKEKGWFPKVILSQVKKINKLHFKKELIDLAKQLEKQHTREKQYALICKYINIMLKAHPKFIGNNIPFMSLSNFESLLTCSDINNNDHVFHSARVFLIGCIIIDKYYDKFKVCYQNILDSSKINVEYMWLLSSLFHDIGRIKQGAHRILLSNPSEDSPELEEVLEKELSKNWSKDNYKNSLGNIVELIKQSSKKDKDREKPYIGYALGGDVDKKVGDIYMNSYNKRISHGVLGAIDLSADLLNKRKAEGVKRNNFFLYHIFPAALAISFHDWKIWKDLTEEKIFPISFDNYPLAALLIYIDTWDDYKRGTDPKITIDNIVFSDNETKVYITWHDNSDYLDERLKYDSYERNVLFTDLKLSIEVSNKA